MTTLKKYDISEQNIIIDRGPGSFELTHAAKRIAETTKINAVIILGCVIKGETPHFDYVCSRATPGITLLNLTFNIPFILGFLTANNIQEAKKWSRR